jgi:predicted anti-sigma-YlaC factor YlaD
MNCKKYQELIYDYMDGSLSQDIEKEISEHLKVCRECREIYEREGHLSELLKNAMDHKTSSLVIDQSMIRRFKDEKRERKSPVFAWKWSDFGLNPVTLLILVLMIFLSVFVIYSPKSGDETMISLNDRAAVFGLEEDMIMTDSKADWLERRLIIFIMDKKQGIYGKIVTSKDPDKTIMVWEKMEAKK